jgi:hypothetical protein
VTPAAAPTRMWADRRCGADRRVAPRRQAVSAAVPERRRVVDRRRGGERRSTLERRGRAARDRALESPAEHLRNALQLLGELEETGDLWEDARAALEAVRDRLARALGLLERR